LAVSWYSAVAESSRPCTRSAATPIQPRGDSRRELDTVARDADAEVLGSLGGAVGLLAPIRYRGQHVRERAHPAHERRHLRRAAPEREDLFEAIGVHLHLGRRTEVEA
jgi:hypothetical protein